MTNWTNLVFNRANSISAVVVGVVGVMEVELMWNELGCENNWIVVIVIVIVGGDVFGVGWGGMG